MVIPHDLWRLGLTFSRELDVRTSNYTYVGRPIRVGSKSRRQHGPPLAPIIAATATTALAAKHLVGGTRRMISGYLQRPRQKIHDMGIDDLDIAMAQGKVERCDTQYGHVGLARDQDFLARWSNVSESCLSIALAQSGSINVDFRSVARRAVVVSRLDRQVAALRTLDNGGIEIATEAGIVPETETRLDFGSRRLLGESIRFVVVFSRNMHETYRRARFGNAGHQPLCHEVVILENFVLNLILSFELLDDNLRITLDG